MLPQRRRDTPCDQVGGSGELVQSELGAAALRNRLTILIPEVKKALWGDGREFMLYGRPEYVLVCLNQYSFR
jgi:hypothetical protein